ncbi:MAG: RNA-directed DNA polymerase [Phycisphaerae bacterium]|nr:RNA-directed DNA polymerase [Phycisphaerae bacterium]
MESSNLQAMNCKTLRIRTIPHLANQLGIHENGLIDVAENTERYYRDFKRNVKGKDRDLVMSINPLAMLQRRILDRILHRLPISDYAYGAIKGRSILDNAKKHSNSLFIAKFDVKSFYPSVRYQKIYDFFMGQECAPDVSRILTLLTTRKYSLPLGTSTSPMLADQVIQPLDKRICGMAAKAGLKYTRYVDDITISGSYPVEQFTDLVIEIIRQNGFKVKQSKIDVYAPGDGKERIICGVRVQNGKVSASTDYIKTLRGELLKAIQQSQHRDISGDFDTRNQYRGRIGFVMWLDRPEGLKLLSLYRKVKWRHLEWILYERNKSPQKTSL